MAKLLRRLVKRRNSAPIGQPEQSRLQSEDEEPRMNPPEQPRLQSEDEEPRMKPKAKLTALHSYSARIPEDLAFEKG